MTKTNAKFFLVLDCKRQTPRNSDSITNIFLGKFHNCKSLISELSVNVKVLFSGCHSQFILPSFTRYNQYIKCFSTFSHDEVETYSGYRYKVLTNKVD